MNHDNYVGPQHITNMSGPQEIISRFMENKGGQ